MPPSRQSSSSSSGRDNTATSLDHSASRRKRKRPLYSHNKCIQCRDRRLKCQPELRQWPREKCDSCEKSGLPCSPVQSLQEYKRQKIRSAPVRHAAAPVESGTPAEQLLQDCWLALGWCQMLDQILHVAKNIDTSLRKTVCSHASGPGVYLFLKDLLSTRSKAYDLLCRHVIQTCQEDASISTAELCGLLDAIIEGRLEADPSLLAVETMLCQLIDSRRSGPHTTRVLEPSISKMHILYRAEMDRLDKSIDECDESLEKVIEKYTGGLKSVWDGISDLCERDNLFTTTRTSFMNPFIHEFYIREQDPLFHILSPLEIGAVEIDWTHIFTDSLGRTPLHYATGLLNSIRWTYSDWEATLQDNTGLLNTGDVFGRTPLHIASAADCLERSELQLQVIEALLKAGAKISIRDEYGLLAIEYAVYNKRADIVAVFQRTRNLDLGGMLSEISHAQVALKKACDIAKASITGNDELDTETDSDSEESESESPWPILRVLRR
ncbi:hypothetical protein F5Y01DRAFT_278907 [Xylaria sp. FL0043]|nr:hypothetical protein F5Y01DRAFT_278907 [Xylaria sp. FL0043]